MAVLLILFSLRFDIVNFGSPLSLENMFYDFMSFKLFSSGYKPCQDICVPDIYVPAKTVQNAKSVQDIWFPDKIVPKLSRTWLVP